MINKIINIAIAGFILAGIVEGYIGFLSSKPVTSQGSVYYLNFKPEQDLAWKKLAKIYSQNTGVPG